MKSTTATVPRWLRHALAAGAVVALSLANAGQAQTVDKMIFFSTDVSGSIDNSEYNIQRQGWANAFQLQSIKNFIAASPNGIAVAVGQWDNTALTPLAIDWTHLTDEASINAFAQQLQTMSRQGTGLTCVSCAITAATNSIQNAVSGGLFSANTRIIDISSDGIDNVTSVSAVRASRDAASQLGIAINALAIEGDQGLTGVSDYYRDNVITTGGFVQTVNGFADFDTAAATKLRREISGAPGPLPVVGSIMALGWARSLRRRSARSMVGADSSVGA
jgi:hypothetical protein